MIAKSPQSGKGPVFTLLFSLFVVMMGYGVLLPVLPFFVERLAITPGTDSKTINYHIGALTAVYPLFQLVFNVVWGRLSDRAGRRGFIIMGLLGFILMQVLLGLATSLPMLYVARITGGILTAALIPVSNAYLSDMTTPANRSKAMAWSGTAVSLGIIVGPVAGGYLSKTDFHLSIRAGIFHLDRFSIPFFALVIPAIIALALVLRNLDNNPAGSTRKLSVEAVALNRSIHYPLLVLLVLTLVYQFSVTSFETVFSLYAKNDLSFNAPQIGVGFMLCGLFMAIFQPVFTALDSKWISETGKLIAGFFVAAVSLLVFPLADGYTTVYGLIILFAVGGALIAPQLTALISLKDETNTAKNLSYQSSVNSMGQVLGPVVGTWLTGKQVFAPFLLGGSLLIIPALAILWHNWREKKRA
jgi:DHA1 family multidrug resistance protein-like MFS transporter